MTKSQIDMIRARESERANRAQEELKKIDQKLVKRGQNLKLVGDLAKGIGTKVVGGIK